MKTTLLFLACCAFPLGGFAAFSFDDDGKRLLVSENDRPVFAYQYSRVDAPKGMDPELSRSNYIHPVYGIDGEILTEDFPKDHPHHRGIYWTWPVVSVDGKTADPWALTGARQLFREWIRKEAETDGALLAFRGDWRFDGETEPFVTEEIEIRVHPAKTETRAIDFTVRLENVHEKPVSFSGRPRTGYGGFNIRPLGNSAGKTITTAGGKLDADSLDDESPWADFSSVVSEDGAVAGIALFQHPENPDYPHPGWILRHYGFLGHAWPHRKPRTLDPGETVTLRYRVLIHRGNAETAAVASEFEKFTKTSK